MPESIGQRLKREREARRLTLEKAAEATRLRLHYLQALENDDYSVMASAAQGRGFLRNYADFLGVDLDEAVADVRRVDSPPPAPDAAPEPIPVPEPSASTPAPKVGRGGFWSRLLRRSSAAPEAVSPAGEPAPTEEVITGPVAPVVIGNPPEAEEPSAPLKEAPLKPAPKKAASKTSRAKATGAAKPRATSKKKQSLNLNPKR